MVKLIEPWGILLAVIGLFLSLGAFWSDYSARVEDRAVRAWTLVTTRAPGNSGKIEALEYLNREDGFLCFEWLRGRLGWLHGGGRDLFELRERSSCIFLFKPKTPLTGIDLRPVLEGEFNEKWPTPVGPYLVDIDLSEAILIGANLDFAFLQNADLRSAVLSGVGLTSAQLEGADLAGAHLNETNLRGADLSKAKGLIQKQLDKACGDGGTRLPPGLTIPQCQDEQQPEAGE